MKEKNKLKEELEELVIYIIMGIIIVIFSIFVNYINEEFYTDENLDYIYIVIFIITIFKFFIDNFIEKIKLKRLEKKEIINKIDMQYYRNILQETSPAILSIIFDRKLNYEKDFVASLLYLENEGYLKIDDKIEYTGKDYDNLPESLQFIIKKRDYLFVTTDQYTDNLEKRKTILINEYLNNGREKKLVKTINKKVKVKDSEQEIDVIELYYEEIVCEELVYIVFMQIQGADYYQYMGVYRDLLKNKKYNVSFYQSWSTICYKELVDKGYHKERKKYHFSISTIILIIAIVTLPFFSSSEEKYMIYFIYSCILFCLIMFSKINAERKNSHIMTQKGYEIYRKLIGLRNYISDFSKLEDRTINEIKLWDDYMIYAIILNEKNNLIDESIEKINNLYKNIKQ